MSDMNANVHISEIDNTSPASTNANEYVVFIPGPCTKSGAKTEYEFAPKSDISDYFLAADKTSVSYKMAANLVALGFRVLYVVVSSTKSTAITQLQKYDLVEGDAEGTFHWSKYEDKGHYNIMFFFTSEYIDKEVSENAMKCAAKRTDAVALVDVPDTNKDSYNIESYVKSLFNAESGTSRFVERDKCDDDDVTVKEDPLAYGAAFTSSVTYEEDSTEYPATFNYLACFGAHNMKDAPAWFATSGSQRGVAPYGAVTPKNTYNEADIIKLQDKRTAGNRAVNLILEKRPYGNVIWGARTLFPNQGGELKACSYLNIRVLCCLIKKTLYEASIRYMFDPNSDVLWINFKSLITPLLEEMKANQGIKGYKIIKEQTNKKATLKARIQIIPIEPVEDFYLTVNMVDSIIEVNE